MKSNFFVSVIKVFIYAFLGVFIPELCILLTPAAGLEITLGASVLVPAVCAALAAALSAAWEYVSSVFKHDVPVVEIVEEISEY